MQDAGILTDTTYMDTQMEKSRFNKLALFGFSLLVVSLIIWLPIFLGLIGYWVGANEVMATLVADKLPATIVAFSLPLISLILSFTASMQIKRRKERGKLLSISSFVCVILLIFAWLYVISWFNANYQ